MLIKEKYATIYSGLDAQYARMQTFNCLAAIQMKVAKFK
jgi:hypothetical protein